MRMRSALHRIRAAMLLMAVGVLFKYGCLTGSCGGLALLATRTKSVRCPWCLLGDRPERGERSRVA